MISADAFLNNYCNLLEILLRIVCVHSSSREINNQKTENITDFNTGAYAALEVINNLKKDILEFPFKSGVESHLLKFEEPISIYYKAAFYSFSDNDREAIRNNILIFLEAKEKIIKENIKVKEPEIKQLFTMPSECYWCIDGKAAYGNQKGIIGNPFACCHRCQVFCCGHHGERDNSAQKFYCFDCDKTILIVSAIKAANASAEDIMLIGQKSERIQKAVSTIVDTFTSVEDFVKRKPGYSGLMKNIDSSSIDYNSWNDLTLKGIFEDFPPQAQKLLVAAAILIENTDTEQNLKELGDSLLLNLKTHVKIPRVD